MTQKEFIKLYKKIIGEKKSLADAKREVKAFIVALESALTKSPEGKVTFPGFGTFSKIKTNEKRIINPLVGEAILPARTKIKFKESKSLILRIREK